MIAARIGRAWKTFGYSSVISLTCWRSRARGTQESVEERTCPLHFALGAALPTTLLGDVDVVDTAGHAWTFSDNAPAPGVSTRLLEIIDRSPREAPIGDAVVYVDLLPTRSDPAVDRLVEAPSWPARQCVPHPDQWLKGTCSPRTQAQ